jgi:hypothetical protein
LTNADIEHSQPKAVKFISTREASNPLDPKYKLPKFEYVAPEPPKFIRCSMQISDIQGTSATLKDRSKTPKDIISVRDILGAGNLGQKGFVDGFGFR